MRLKVDPALAKEWKTSTTSVPSNIIQQTLSTDVWLGDNPELAEQ